MKNEYNLPVFFVACLVPFFGMSQNQPPSTDQNFVRTETVLVDGITDEYDLGQLSSNDKATTYEYFDENGRPTQTVAVEASVGGHDIVHGFEYDTQGRQLKSYLPYTEQTGTHGQFRPNWATEQASFYNSGSLVVAQDTRPFSQNKLLDNRVDEVFGPGSDWYTNGKKQHPDFRLNNSSEVRLWDVKDGSPISWSFYPEHTLLVSEITDEESKTSFRYATLEGQTVLTKTHDGKFTYYVYDDFGNLNFLLTPESVVDLPDEAAGYAGYVSGQYTTAIYEDKSYVYGPDGGVLLDAGFNFDSSNKPFSVTVGAPPQGILDDFVFQYEYDDYQRLIKEKKPGAGWIYYVYDKWDRLVLSQDGLQRAESPDEWSFVKYDELNRTIATGILKSNDSHSVMQTNAMATSIRFESETTDVIGYTLTGSFPTNIGSGDLLTITYYDDYSHLSNNNWDAEANNYTLNLPLGFSGIQASLVKGLTTGSKVKILGTTKWLNSVVYYDDEYRTLQTIGENHIDGTDRTSNQYDFVRLIKSVTEHQTSFGVIDIIEEYTYDQAGRLLDLKHSIDNTEILMAQYAYNELDQLVEKNIHSTDNGTSFIQELDYRYNIRGWLTSINNAQLTDDGGITNDDTSDLFGLQLGYNGTSISIDSQPTQSYYNGNISSQRWQSKDQVQRAFGYTYDDSYQLEQATFGAGSGTTFNAEGGYYDVDNLTYDQNGNIQTLKRSGLWGTKTTMDDLSYGYDGNKVLNVEDNGSSQGFTNNVVGLNTEYSYDENGNLSYDLNKLIVEIKYNDLNLVEYVEFDSGIKIYSIYDAAGVLLTKEVKDGNTSLHKTEYVGAVVYENDAISFMHTPEGRAIPGESGGAWDYEYYYTDHLGNIRMVYGHFNETHAYKATMETGKAADEAAFDNMSTAQSGTNVPNHTIPDPLDPIPSYSAQLNPVPVGGSAIGPALTLAVSTGDKISLETWARYSGNDNGTAGVVTDIATLLTTALGITPGGSGEAAHTAIHNSLPGLAGTIAANYNEGAPKAYLNYILFDNSYVQRQFGYLAISDDAYNDFEKLALEVTMTHSGYLYIYVANESKADINVWFDDLTIIHEKSTKLLQIVGAKDYYPFGLPIMGTYYWNDGRKSYKYGYQGIYAQEDSLSEWNTFALRNYDPELGRFISVDPEGQFSSTYLAMGNNPINYIDPDGAFGVPAILTAFKAGAVLGATRSATSYFANSQGNGDFDPKDFVLNTGKGALREGVKSVVGAGLGEMGLNIATQLSLSENGGITLSDGFINVGYQSLSTTVTSVISNMAIGNAPFEQLDIGIGDFNLPIRNGKISGNVFDHIENATTVFSYSRGFLDVKAGNSEMTFNKLTLSPSFRETKASKYGFAFIDEKNGLRGEFNPDNKKFRGTTTNMLDRSSSRTEETLGLNQNGASFLRFNAGKPVYFHESLHAIYGRVAGKYLPWINYHVLGGKNQIHDNRSYERVLERNLNKVMR